MLRQAETFGVKRTVLFTCLIMRCGSLSEVSSSILISLFDWFLMEQGMASSACRPDALQGSICVAVHLTAAFRHVDILGRVGLQAVIIKVGKGIFSLVDNLSTTGVIVSAHSRLDQISIDFLALVLATVDLRRSLGALAKSAITATFAPTLHFIET